MDLPHDLRLPLERGAPWWYWLGGRPALDLVNTLRERWRRRVETLVVPEDVAGWLVAARVLHEPVPAGVDHLRRARELREAIDSAVLAVIGGRRVPDGSIALIGETLNEAVVGEELVRGSDGALLLRPAAPRDPVAHGLGVVARDAAAMVGPGEAGRIRICGSQTCSARFYDRSPAGRRRWCSMSGCGNVEKARRHRRRQKEDLDG
jgi:predicted RNA-binding Zn ribbon-like protein